MLKLTNSLTGKKENFQPLVPEHVSLYVCGVTPYDDAHIGHGRCYIAFDTLYRLLKFLDYKVTYVRNFTDIDDKLINKAEKIFNDKSRFKEIADQFIDHYHADMHTLNLLSPTQEPTVTENIPEIIKFIQQLIDKGHAYVVEGNVYFSIRSFPEYGRLSKHQLQDLRAGARVDIREQKKDPLDFALWKVEKEGTFFKSPWGYGRPGWHIECSALASKYLGEQIDIHGGGFDLVFPHHENEIAQSESLHEKPFARFWVHNGLITVDKEKMSKSIGNVFTLRDIFKYYDPMIIRFYLLNHHYRAPLDFSQESIDAKKKSYQRLCRMFENIQAIEDKEAMQQIPVIQHMLEFLKDDLNTVGMLGVLFENLSDIAQDEKTAGLVKGFLQLTLGLTLKPIKEKETEITPEVQKLIDEREMARKEKNWSRADEIRDQLIKMGIKIQDKKD